MAQIAKSPATKTADAASAKSVTGNVAELRQRATDQTAERAEDAARQGAETLRRAAGAAGEARRELTRLSTAGANELGRLFVELASEQTRQNLETLKALSGAVDWDRFAKAVDWDQVRQIQGAYLRASLERTTRLTQRYVEVCQAMTASATSAFQRQAKKAA